MKYIKVFCFPFLICFLFTSIIFAQKIDFDELMKNGVDRVMLLENLGQIEKNRLVTEGSPFNNNTNSQIDSVVLKKVISSSEVDTIKYFYTYDSIGNVANVLNLNHWDKTFTYDNNGNILITVFRYWNNGLWRNSSRASFVYDTLGNRTLLLNERWIDSAWVNNRQVTFLYNSNGDETSFLWKDWDGGEWMNSFRGTSTYDSNFVLLTELFQNWGVNDWNGYSWRNSYTYDSNGNLIIFLSEDLYNNKWVNDGRFILEYDKRDNNILYVYETWIDYKWISYSRVIKTYNNNNKITSLKEEKRNSNKWVNSLQTIYTYNSNGDMSYAKSEMWENYINSWVPGNGSMFIYDKDGNRRSYFGSDVVIYYPTITNINDKELFTENYSLSQNYPNPFNPSTKIRYSLPQSGFVQLKIYDILGREIATLVNEEQAKGNYKIDFNASSLTSGVYIYKLNVGASTGSVTFTKTKKMLLTK